MLIYFHNKKIVNESIEYEAMLKYLERTETNQNYTRQKLRTD
jgi:hypothetical protein